MDEFNIGDTVEVIGGGYSITGVGSWGYIEEIDTNHCVVNFVEYHNSALTGELITTWAINKRMLKRVASSNLPYSAVIRKINEIDRKRKALGYKY